MAEDKAAALKDSMRVDIAELRELFGETLEDPEARFELGLALRAG